MPDSHDVSALEILVLILALSLSAALVSPCSSYAEGNSVRALELAVAKVAVNESGFHSPADVALIWQVVEGRSRTPEGRLSWLRRHSSCVLGPEPPQEARGNCEWTWHLRWDDSRPQAWPGSVEWRPERWARVRRLVRRLVRGQERRRVCSERPETWGGRAIDTAQALRRGLVPLGCEGTLNEGFRYPR